MSFTGQPGTVLSRAGNTVPAYGAKVSGALALTGILPSQVGPEYDFAMGFDPGIGTAQMYGYCLTEKGTWEEGTNLSDVQKLISVASASTTDRDLTKWPKVSQGDWTTGERQVISIDPTRYFSSDGQVDTTTQAALTLYPSATTAVSIAQGSLGGQNRWPLADDGDQWYLGTPGGSVYVGKRDGSLQLVTVNAGNEILDLLEGLAASAPGVWASTVAGIWFIDGTTYAVTQWVGDALDIHASPGMAYINGRLNYVQSSGHNVAFVSVAGTIAGTAATAVSPMDGFIRSLAYQAAGLIYATTPNDQPGTTPSGFSVLWTANSDATNPVRVGLIPGVVKYMHTTNGVTYILAHEAEPIPGYNLTLYTFSSGTLAILDDMRWALPEFKANVAATSFYSGCQVYGDGRFVYISWPGLQGIQLDLITPSKGIGISRVAGTGLPRTTVLAHRIVRTSSHGFVDLSINTLGGSVQTFNQPANSGNITTSYYDFGTPSLVKFYRSFDIDLAAPLPAGAGITVNFQADAATTWTPLTVNANTATNLVAYFPKGVRAARVRYQVILQAGVGGAPVIRSWATKANLGRIWHCVASAKRHQQTNLGDDNQGALAQDLLANVEGAYGNAGRCLLYVSSPSIKGVELVNAVLEDYKWTVAKPAPRQDEQGALDIEGDVELTFSEQI